MTRPPLSHNVIPVSSKNGLGAAFGRLAGCLWLAIGAFAFLVVAGAAGVGIDATFLLVPLAVLPLALAVMVFIRGDRPTVLVVSAFLAFAYALLGAWNYVRAAAFEAANPGSMEISGGGVSIAFGLLAVATGLWSLLAAGLAGRRKDA